MNPMAAMASAMAQSQTALGTEWKSPYCVCTCHTLYIRNIRQKQKPPPVFDKNLCKTCFTEFFAGWEDTLTSLHFESNSEEIA